MVLKDLNNLRKIIKDKWPLIFLILIVLLATGLRIISLANYPNYFGQDEALNGYEAYSLLKTGRDHRGNFLPIIFEGFSDKVDNRPPIYFYAAIPSIFIFGLNEFSTRLPAAIFGILTVLLTYFLTKELFKKKIIALFASFFLAISPWHIFLSRWAGQTIFTPFFSLLALFFWFKAINHRPIKKNFLYLSGLSFGMLLYTYEVIKAFLPLILFGLIFTYYQTIKENKKIFFITMLLFFLIVLPYLFIHLKFWNKIQGHFNQISIFNFWFWPILFLLNYLIYLNPIFFLLHYPLPVVILAIVGLYFFWQKRKRKKFQILLWLIITSLVPTAFTLSNPHSLRALTLIPFIEISAAYGLWKIITLLSEKKVPTRKSFSFLILIIFFLIIFNIDYLLKIGYPNLYIPIEIKQLGIKRVINYLQKVENNYNEIFVSLRSGNQPYIFFLFYQKYDPKKFQSLKVERRYLKDNWQVVTSFDKYRFCDINYCYSPEKRGVLYVATEKEVPYLKEKKIFYNLDGSVFRIITNE